LPYFACKLIGLYAKTRRGEDVFYFLHLRVCVPETAIKENSPFINDFICQYDRPKSTLEKCGSLIVLIFISDQLLFIIM